MIIKEYRIPVPVSLAEYQIGQLYTVSEASKSETAKGEGVEVVTNEPFQDGDKSGQYTHKIYHLNSKVPSVIRVLVPGGALRIHEKAWNSFPYCKTVMTNEYMKESFHLTVESFHVDNEIASVDNALNMSEELKKRREVIMVDIANDPVDSKDYKPLEDPKLFHSEKTQRGPLGKEWMKEASVRMTCYKLVTVELKIFGMQGMLENLIQKAIRGIYTKFNRQLFCWIDKWFGMEMEDIRRLEEQTQQDLKDKLKQ